MKTTPEQDWRLRYWAQIFNMTSDAQMADISAEAAEYEPDENPEDAADCEMSYWD